MQDVLDKAPKVIALVSFGTVFLTVIHEWGYFTVVGSHFLTLATTYDFLANALVWLPTLGFASVALQSFESALHFKDGKLVFGGLFYFGWVSSVLGFVAYFLLGGSAEFSVASFLSFFAAYSVGRALPQPIEKEKQRFFRFLLVFVWGAFAIFGYGTRSGYDDLRKTSDVYAITEKEGGAVRNIVLLRSFEKGLLVRDATESRIQFLRWDNVVSVGRIKLPTKEVGYLCLWYGSFCGKDGLFFP